MDARGEREPCCPAALPSSCEMRGIPIQDAQWRRLPGGIELLLKRGAAPVKFLPAGSALGRDRAHLSLLASPVLPRGLPSSAPNSPWLMERLHTGGSLRRRI